MGVFSNLDVQTSAVCGLATFHQSMLLKPLSKLGDCS